jgi:hypothetical protein
MDTFELAKAKDQLEDLVRLAAAGQDVRITDARYGTMRLTPRAGHTYALRRHPSPVRAAGTGSRTRAVLVALAIAEGPMLLTSDAQLPGTGAPVIW